MNKIVRINFLNDPKAVTEINFSSGERYCLLVNRKVVKKYKFLDQAVEDSLKASTFSKERHIISRYSTQFDANTGVNLC